VFKVFKNLKTLQGFKSDFHGPGYTKEEFNVDSKAECDQLNLAHVVRKI